MTVLPIDDRDLRPTPSARAVPDSVRIEVEAALGGAASEGGGAAPGIAGAERVAGGSINAAARIERTDGRSFFLKWNAGAAADFFEVEADGLRALARAAPAEVLVPEPIALGTGGNGAPPWLLLPFVERGASDGRWEARLGRGLAALHGKVPDGWEDRWGWDRDNVIGALPQENTPAPDWAAFWRDRRIVPQLRRARAEGAFGGRAAEILDRLVDRIDEALAGVEDDGPSLLHGDLWGGNVFGAADGRAVLVDPAVYVGHHEVDLAMSELFGFPGGFADAYRESRAVDPGYGSHRRDLYQLYYLLVHVNLFGGGYVSGSVRAAERVLAAL